MSFRTSLEKMKADPLHLGWIIVYIAIGFLVIQIIPSYVGYAVRGIPPGGILSAPYVSVGGMLINEGLMRFSGEQIPTVWTLEHTIILGSVLGSYVIALPLFVWALRERLLWRQKMEKQGFPLANVVAFGLSGPFVIPVLFMSLFVGFISWEVWGSMKQAQQSRANSDHLVYTTSSASLRAQSFYFVSVENGGGGRAWMNIKGRSSTTIQLEDIVQEERSMAQVFKPHFSPVMPYRMILEVHAEDSLSIWGIGEQDGNVRLFVNKDGSEGRAQVYATVTPRNSVVRIQN